MTSRSHSQLKNLDRCACVRLAMIGRSSATPSTSSMTSRRLMSWMMRPRQTGSTMLSKHVNRLPPAALARLLLGVALDEVGGPLFDGVGRERRRQPFSALALASNFRAAGSRPCASSCSASVAALRAAASVSARSRVSFFGRPSYR